MDLKCASESKTAHLYNFLQVHSCLQRPVSACASSCNK